VSDPAAAGLLPLSVFLIARNEADRIGATLRAVRGLTDDLVVVDSGSTDGTQAWRHCSSAKRFCGP
jgi:glycosyltransferase involved in cell wall biosynthesis